MWALRDCVTTRELGFSLGAPRRYGRSFLHSSFCAGFCALYCSTCRAARVGLRSSHFLCYFLLHRTGFRRERTQCCPNRFGHTRQNRLVPRRSLTVHSKPLCSTQTL